jgi:hypothetical protein
VTFATMGSIAPVERMGKGGVVSPSTDERLQLTSLKTLSPKGPLTVATAIRRRVSESVCPGCVVEELPEFDNRR